MDWVTRRRGNRVKRIGGLYGQSQFIAEDADDTASESENSGHESNAILNFYVLMINNLLGGAHR